MKEDQEKIEAEGNIFSGISYFIGAFNFLIGSISFIPYLYQYLEWQYIGGICYTFGSFLFCVNDVIILYTLLKSKQNFYSRIVQMCGSSSYVAGSFLFIPHFTNVKAGDALFITGSGLILCCRIWLYYKTKYDLPGFILSNVIFQIGGASSFLVGPVIQLFGDDFTSAILYIVGGSSFLFGSICNLFAQLQKRKRIQKQNDSLIAD